MLWFLFLCFLTTFLDVKKETLKKKHEKTTNLKRQQKTKNNNHKRKSKNIEKRKPKEKHKLCLNVLKQFFKS